MLTGLAGRALRRGGVAGMTVAAADPAPAASYAVHPVGATPWPIQNANSRSFPDADRRHLDGRAVGEGDPQPRHPRRGRRRTPRPGGSPPQPPRTAVVASRAGRHAHVARRPAAGTKQVPHGPSYAVADQARPSAVPCADDAAVARRRRPGPACSQSPNGAHPGRGSNGTAVAVWPLSAFGPPRCAVRLSTVMRRRAPPRRRSGGPAR